MRDVGEPWMADGHDLNPQEGSALAGDDKMTPKTSPVASYGVLTALDHLGAVVDAMQSDTPLRHYAHFTTLRTALLSSARVRWLLEPGSRTERRLRCVRIRYQNLCEQRTAVRELAGSHVPVAIEQERLKTVAGMDAQEAELEARAKALGAAALAKPDDTVSVLRSQVDPNTWEGMGIRQTWRTGSAAAHGYHWPDEHRPNPGEFDTVAFNSALYAAVMHVKAAAELYEVRATRHIP